MKINLIFNDSLFQLNIPNTNEHPNDIYSLLNTIPNIILSKTKKHNYIIYTPNGKIIPLTSHISELQLNITDTSNTFILRECLPFINVNEPERLSPNTPSKTRANINHSIFKELSKYTNAKTELSINETTVPSSANNSNITSNRRRNALSLNQTHLSFFIEVLTRGYSMLYDEQHLTRMLEMGFERTQAIVALRVSNNNIENASNMILNLGDFPLEQYDILSLTNDDIRQTMNFFPSIAAMNIGDLLLDRYSPMNIDNDNDNDNESEDDNESGIEMFFHSFHNESESGDDDDDDDNSSFD